MSKSKGGRNSRGHVHITTMGGVGDVRELTHAEIVAGRLLEERRQRALGTRARNKAEKDELLRPRRYIPKEGSEGKA